MHASIHLPSTVYNVSIQPLTYMSIYLNAHPPTHPSKHCPLAHPHIPPAHLSIRPLSHHPARASSTHSPGHLPSFTYIFMHPSLLCVHFHVLITSYVEGAGQIPGLHVLSQSLGNLSFLLGWDGTSASLLPPKAEPKETGLTKPIE